MGKNVSYRTRISDMQTSLSVYCQGFKDAINFTSTYSSINRCCIWLLIYDTNMSQNDSFLLRLSHFCVTFRIGTLDKFMILFLYDCCNSAFQKHGNICAKIDKIYLQQSLAKRKTTFILSICLPLLHMASHFHV